MSEVQMVGSFPILIYKWYSFLQSFWPANANMFFANTTWDKWASLAINDDWDRFSIWLLSWWLDVFTVWWLFEPDWRLQAGSDISSVITDDKDFITKKYFDDNIWWAWRCISYSQAVDWDFADFYADNSLDTDLTYLIMDSDVVLSNWDNLDLNNIRFIWNWNNLHFNNWSTFFGVIRADNVRIINEWWTSNNTQWWDVYLYNGSTIQWNWEPIYSLNWKATVRIYAYDRSNISTNVVEMTDSLANFNVYLLWNETTIETNTIKEMTDWTVNCYYEKIAVTWIRDLENANVVWGTVNWCRLIDNSVWKVLASAGQFSESLWINSRQVVVDTIDWDVELTLMDAQNMVNDYLYITLYSWDNDLNIVTSSWDTINWLTWYTLDTVWQSITLFAADKDTFYIVNDYSYPLLSSKLENLTTYYIPYTKGGVFYNSAIYNIDNKLGIWEDYPVTIESTGFVALSWALTYPLLAINTTISSGWFPINWIWGSVNEDPIWWLIWINDWYKKSANLEAIKEDELDAVSRFTIIDDDILTMAEPTILEAGLEVKDGNINIYDSSFYVKDRWNIIENETIHKLWLNEVYLSTTNFWNSEYIQRFEIDGGIDTATATFSDTNVEFTNPTTAWLDFRFAWSGGLMEGQYYTGWAWVTATMSWWVFLP